MKKVTFTRVETTASKRTQTPTNGYEFEHEGITLVVHRGIMGWMVSEPSTGLYIVRGDYALRPDAMAAAVQRIDIIGVDRTRKNIGDLLSGRRTIP